MTMPPLPPAGDTTWYDDWAPAVHSAATEVVSGRLAATNLAETIRDTMGTALVAGSNVTITPSDAGDTVTIASTGGGGGTSSGVTNVLDYGATGNDVADDTTGVQAAINACPSGGVLLFPAGKTFRVSAVTFGAKPVTVLAHGAKIRATTAGTYAFTQSNRQRVTWLGGSFIGVGSGFKLNLTASAAQSYDFAFTGVSFDLPAAQTALYIVGGREGTITNCFFDNCTGMRLTETVNTHITGCQFRNCTKGIWGDGVNGSANNAGIMLNNVTMLGCGYGLHAVAHDWVSIVNSMIDYCDRPVVLVNQDIATIADSYFSNREFSGGTQVAPTIHVLTDAGQAGEGAKHIRITGCSIINNVAALPQQAVGVKFEGGVTWASVTNCSLHFWRKYGVQVTGVTTYLKITGNDFVHVGSESGAASVYGTNGNDSTWLIGDNFLSLPTANILYAVTRDASGMQAAIETKATATAVEGIKVHDGTAGGGTRPTGFARVRWVGGASRPTNMLAGDVWEHDIG